MSTWTQRGYGTSTAPYWAYRVGRCEVTLEPRPHYCDRGRWIGKVFWVPDIDSADSFPRYYMDLERAKSELSEWLEMRVKSSGLAEAVKESP